MSVPDTSTSAGPMVANYTASPVPMSSKHMSGYDKGHAMQGDLAGASVYPVGDVGSVEPGSCGRECASEAAAHAASRSGKVVSLADMEPEYSLDSRGGRVFLLQCNATISVLRSSMPTAVCVECDMAVTMCNKRISIARYARGAELTFTRSLVRYPASGTPADLDPVRYFGSAPHIVKGPSPGTYHAMPSVDGSGQYALSIDIRSLSVRWLLSGESPCVRTGDTYVTAHDVGTKGYTMLITEDVQTRAVRRIEMRSAGVISCTLHVDMQKGYVLAGVQHSDVDVDGTVILRNKTGFAIISIPRDGGCPYQRRHILCPVKHFEHLFLAGGKLFVSASGNGKTKMEGALRCYSLQ